MNLSKGKGWGGGAGLADVFRQVRQQIFPFYYPIKKSCCGTFAWKLRAFKPYTLLSEEFAKIATTKI